MISLITTVGARSRVLFVPGVSDCSREKLGAPSGKRPVETPFSWASKRTASSTRVACGFLKNKSSPPEFKLKPSVVS